MDVSLSTAVFEQIVIAREELLGADQRRIKTVVLGIITDSQSHLRPTLAAAVLPTRFFRLTPFRAAFASHDICWLDVQICRLDLGGNLMLIAAKVLRCTTWMSDLALPETCTDHRQLMAEVRREAHWAEKDARLVGLSHCIGLPMAHIYLSKE